MMMVAGPYLSKKSWVRSRFSFLKKRDPSLRKSFGPR